MNSTVNQIKELISARDTFAIGSIAHEALQAKIDGLVELLPIAQKTDDYENGRFFAKLYA